MPKSTATRHPVVVDEQVTGMHVGVKEAVAQGVAQEALGHDARQVLQVDALGFERGMVRQMRAVDPFERQHFLGGAIPVDRRHAKSRIVLGILRHFGQSRGLEPKIHLERDRAAQGRHRLDQPEPARFCGYVFRMARGEREGVLIDREAPLDAGPQHLDRDRSHSVGVLDLGAVHLRDRGGRDRGAERRRRSGRSAGRRPSQRSRPLPHAGTAACGPADFRAHARSRVRPRPAGWRGIARASHRWDRVASVLQRGGRLHHPCPAARSVWRRAIRSRAGTGSSAGSSSRNTPSRANT